MTLVVERDDGSAKEIPLHSTIERDADDDAVDRTTNIGQWVIERAFQIDERSGSLSNARDFLAAVVSSSNSCLENASVSNALQSASSLCAFVFLKEAYNDIDALFQMRVYSVSLREFHGKSSSEKLSLLLNLSLIHISEPTRPY